MDQTSSRADKLTARTDAEDFVNSSGGHHYTIDLSGGALRDQSSHRSHRQAAHRRVGIYDPFVEMLTASGVWRTVIGTSQEAAGHHARFRRRRCPQFHRVCAIPGTSRRPWARFDDPEATSGSPPVHNYTTVPNGRPFHAGGLIYGKQSARRLGRAAPKRRRRLRSSTTSPTDLDGPITSGFTRRSGGRSTEPTDRKLPAHGAEHAESGTASRKPRLDAQSKLSDRSARPFFRRFQARGRCVPYFSARAVGPGTTNALTHPWFFCSLITNFPTTALNSLESRWTSPLSESPGHYLEVFRQPRPLLVNFKPIGAPTYCRSSHFGLFRKEQTEGVSRDL